jgi:hypothetical protein
MCRHNEAPVKTVFAIAFFLLSSTLIVLAGCESGQTALDQTATEPITGLTHITFMQSRMNTNDTNCDRYFREIRAIRDNFLLTA